MVEHSFYTANSVLYVRPKSALAFTRMSRVKARRVGPDHGVNTIARRRGDAGVAVALYLSR